VFDETFTLFNFRESFPESSEWDLLCLVEVVLGKLLDVLVFRNVITNFLLGTWPLFNFLQD
jgi:hypothetical protein